MKIDIEWGLNMSDTGSIQVDKDELDEAFRDGGLAAVNEKAQELVDDWVSNNVVGISTDFDSWELDEEEEEE